MRRGGGAVAGLTAQDWRTLSMLGGRVGAAAALTAGYLAGRRRLGAHRLEPAGRRPRRRGLALTTSLLPPLAAGCVSWPNARWRPPGTPAGQLLLAGQLGSGVLIEEALWRGPLVCLPPGPRRTAATLASGAGFVAAHLRRDGVRPAQLGIHLATTAAWTAAALLDGRLRWPLLGHAAYNVIAVSLQPPPAVESAR